MNPIPGALLLPETPLTPFVPAREQKWDIKQWSVIILRDL